jgi:hypothetical protein
MARLDRATRLFVSISLQIEVEAEAGLRQRGRRIQFSSLCSLIIKKL